MLIQLPMRGDKEFGNIQSQDLRESVENLGILLQKRILQARSIGEKLLIGVLIQVALTGEGTHHRLVSDNAAVDHAVGQRLVHRHGIHNLLRQCGYVSVDIICRIFKKGLSITHLDNKSAFSAHGLAHTGIAAVDEDTLGCDICS